MEGWAVPAPPQCPPPPAIRIIKSRLGRRHRTEHVLAPCCDAHAHVHTTSTTCHDNFLSSFLVGIHHLALLIVVVLLTVVLLIILSTLIVLNILLVT